MDVMDRFEMISLPAGAARVGSTPDDVERCVREWSGRLVSPDYTEEKFRTWILKECPRWSVPVGAFAVSRYPVTNAWYAEFVLATGAREPESMRAREPGRHPVWGVHLAEAEAFCAWVRERSGAPVRLPTEVEWEYAARGPWGWEYPFGEVFDARLCNTREAGRGATTRVDAHDHCPSAFGVRDLAGNVEEWTADRFEDYSNTECWARFGATNPLCVPRLVSGATNITVRGGSWIGTEMRSASRSPGGSNARQGYTGFRCARSR